MSVLSSCALVTRAATIRSNSFEIVRELTTITTLLHESTSYSILEQFSLRWYEYFAFSVL